MDPGEESFTLSSFDFNSSFAFYSSDDDDNNYCVNYEQIDMRNRDDVDAYIELELPLVAMVATTSPPSPFQVAAADYDDDDEELELRISFSAVVPFPGFFPSSKPPISACEGANDRLPTAVDSSPLPAVESVLSCIHEEPLTNHSTVSVFPLSWTKLPLPVDGEYPDNCRRPLGHINGWEIVRRRNFASSKIDSATIAGISKLLVKLRSIVISGLGSMRASLAQAGIAGNQAQKRCANSRRLTSAKPFERWLTFCKPSERQQQMTAVRTNGGETRSSSKVTEIKFEVMRKLFGSAVSPMRDSGSKSDRPNKSCPTSIKSSPVHQSGDASLVHAAIAHCKRSFGQNDDFSF